MHFLNYNSQFINNDNERVLRENVKQDGGIHAKYALGSFLYYQNRFSEAELLLREVADIETDEIMKVQILANRLLGEYYLSMGEKKEAEKHLFFAANQLDVFAQADLGDLYYAEKPDKAVVWYEKAAEKGHAEAQYYLGKLYLDREDYRNAIKWFEQAEKNGVFDAQEELGRIYICKGEIEKAERYFIPAAKMGSTTAKFYLGVCYYEKMNYTEAIELLLPEERLGNLDAKLMLGKCYLMTELYDEAEKMLLPIAEQGDPEAQSYLGYCYLANKKFNEAQQWLIPLVKKGYSFAQIWIGHYYHYHKEDIHEAKKWYKCAADQGNEDAIRMLKEIDDDYS